MVGPDPPAAYSVVRNKTTSGFLKVRNFVLILVLFLLARARYFMVDGFRLLSSRQKKVVPEAISRA